MLAATSETGEDLEVGTIAGSLDGILARARLPSRERLEPDEARADALELTDRIAERVLGPDRFEGPQRRHDTSALAADEVRELEPDTRALVPRPAVLVGLRSVMPTVLPEQGRDPRRSSSQTAMSTSECGRVVEPAWKSTAQPPNSQYGMAALSRSASTAASAASWRGAEWRRWVTNAKGTPSSETCSSREACTKALAIPLREERVALDVVVDLGQQQLVGERQRRCVDLRAADHEDAVDAVEELERLVERPGALGSVGMPRAFRVTTMLRRPGSGRKRSGSESQVRRPITTACPVVSSLKCAMSSGIRHGIAPSRPITPSRATAATSSDRHTATGARIAGWCS